jgi:hypothetical protein
MARKRRSPDRKAAPQPPLRNGRQPLIPNLSLSRVARIGEATEDELLLQRPKPRKPEPRVPAQAAFTHGDP